MTERKSCDDNGACDSVDVKNLLQSAETVKMGRHIFQSFLKIKQSISNFALKVSSKRDVSKVLLHHVLVYILFLNVQSVLVSVCC